MGRLPLILALVGCSPSVESTNGPNGVDAAGPGGGGKAEVVRYRGTLAATSAVPFGGGTFCSYSVVLNNVDVDVALRNGDELQAMSIEDTMTESIVGTCPYTAEPPNRQMFSHNSERPVKTNPDNRVDPTLVGLAANRPMTSALSTVTVQTDGSLAATIRWERTDQTPPLKWIIATTAPITLQPQACTPKANVCVGGSQGTLTR